MPIAVISICDLSIVAKTTKIPACQPDMAERQGVAT
jgi:hypothetical protein